MMIRPRHQGESPEAYETWAREQWERGVRYTRPDTDADREAAERWADELRRAGKVEYSQPRVSRREREGRAALLDSLGRAKVRF